LPRQRLGAPLGLQLLGAAHDGLDDVLAQVWRERGLPVAVTNTGSSCPVLGLAALCSARISRSSGSMSTSRTPAAVLSRPTTTKAVT
jgi:hypothetical protein